MILGEKRLKELFPNFKEDIEANGIDLRVGKAYSYENNQVCGCVDDEKILPELKEIEPITDDTLHYQIQGGESIFFEIDRPMRIPPNHVQLYYLRSTFVRAGLVLASAVGDAGFEGTLMMTIHNPTKHTVFIGANERLVQAVTYEASECGIYDGLYQNNAIYED